MVENSVVESLQLTLKMVCRKMRLANTSKAFDKGTKNATIDILAGQIVALEMSIQHFSK